MKRVNHNISGENIKKWIVYILVLFSLYFFCTNYNADSVFVLFLFVYIILFCTRKLLQPCPINYGLTQIFYVFNLFFLGIAPLFQYLQHVTIWGGIPFTDRDYVETNLLIISSLWIYQFVYNRTFYNRRYIAISFNKSIDKKSKTSILFIIAVASSLYTIIRHNGDISSLLYRVDDEGDGMNNPIGLINSFIIRPLPAIALLFYIIKRNLSIKRKGISVIEVLWILLVLLILSPIGVPRFVVAAFYIPLALLYIPFLRKKYNLMLFLTFSLIFIFPLLDLVRRAESDYTLINSLDMLLYGHFDSYQMFMRAVSTQCITFGKQLLGVIFFFVPRSIWPTKPVGSGYLIASENNYDFDNISMCFLGEGYINFGYIGVWLFAMFIAYFNGKMDCKYWHLGGKNVSTFAIIYYISLGMEFIVMRGALLNVFPAYIAFLVSVFLVGMLFRSDAKHADVNYLS